MRHIVFSGIASFIAIGSIVVLSTPAKADNFCTQVVEKEWMTMKDCMHMVNTNGKKYCDIADELGMIGKDGKWKSKGECLTAWKKR